MPIIALRKHRQQNLGRRIIYASIMEMEILHLPVSKSLKRFKDETDLDKAIV